jgi:polar amino acid transport system substrate-binding protein
MMSSIKWILKLALLATCAIDVLASELTITTEESPPFNMVVDGKIVGVSSDKVVELMRRAELSYRIDILPWARAYQMALTTPQTCVFSTTRTAEREGKFKWVGPLAFNSWVLYGRADRGIHLNTLEDARSFRIGTYNADVRDTFLRGKGFHVDTVDNDTLNPRKLLHDRIDLWASGPYEAASQITASGLSRQIVPILTFNRVDLYLACNLTTPDEVVDHLNVILNCMDNDGTSMKVDRNYDNWPQRRRQ